MKLKKDKTPKKPNIKHLTYKHINTAVTELYIMLKKANYTPDIIIPIARGGLIPSGILGQYYPEAKYYLIQTKSYTDVENQENYVKVYIPESISTDIDKGSKILIIDDIYDTGKTIKAIIKGLKDRGIKNNIAISTLYLRENTIDQPDFFAESIKRGIWINFPWEKEI